MFGENEALLAKMVVTYEDGTTQTVVTDPSDVEGLHRRPQPLRRQLPGRHVRRQQGSQHRRLDDHQLHQREAQQVAAGRRGPDPSRSSTRRSSPARTRPVREVERLTAERVLTTHSADKHHLHLRHGRQHGRRPERHHPEGLAAGRRRGHLPLRRARSTRATATPRTRCGPVATRATLHPMVPYLEHLRPQRHLPARGGRSHPDPTPTVLRWPWTATRPPWPTPTGTWSITPNFTFRGYQYIEITVPRAAPPRCRSRTSRASSSRPSTSPEGTYEATTSDDNYTGKLANPVLQERPAQPARQLLLAADRLPAAQRADGLDR